MAFYSTEQYIKKELSLAQLDLSSAVGSARACNYRWATLQGASCCLHSVRAILIARGYRGRSHFGMKTALKAHYIDAGLLPKSALVAFDKAMKARSSFEFRYSVPPQVPVRMIELAQDLSEACKRALAADGSA